MFQQSDSVASEKILDNLQWQHPEQSRGVCKLDICSFCHQKLLGFCAPQHQHYNERSNVLPQHNPFSFLAQLWTQVLKVKLQGLRSTAQLWQAIRPLHILLQMAKSQCFNIETTAGVKIGSNWNKIFKISECLHTPTWSLTSQCQWKFSGQISCYFLICAKQQHLPKQTLSLAKEHKKCFPSFNYPSD